VVLSAIPIGIVAAKKTANIATPFEAFNCFAIAAMTTRHHAPDTH